MGCKLSDERGAKLSLAAAGKGGPALLRSAVRLSRNQRCRGQQRWPGPNTVRPDDDRPDTRRRHNGFGASATIRPYLARKMFVKRTGICGIAVLSLRANPAALPTAMINHCLPLARRGT